MIRSCTNRIIPQVDLLLPFRSKRLEMIHIRQTASDRNHYGSWAVHDKLFRATTATGTADGTHSSSWTGSDLGRVPRERADAASEPACTDSHPCSGQEVTLRPDLCRLAEWAFGPRGVASLQIIAYGDFAYGGRGDSQNLCLCKGTDEGKRFQLIAVSDPAWKDVQHKYRNVLEACPAEPLFEEPS